MQAISPCQPPRVTSMHPPAPLYNSTSPFPQSPSPQHTLKHTHTHTHTSLSMGDRDRPQPHQLQVHPQRPGGRDAGMKSLLPQNGPSVSQVLAVITLLPVGGTLLFLAGVTLIGSLIGLAVTTPLFVIFSPVLVPAALTIGLAVTGFLSSGAFGLSGLTSLTYVLNAFKQKAPEKMEEARKKAMDLAAYGGQKTKEIGQTVQVRAQEAKEGGGRSPA